MPTNPANRTSRADRYTLPDGWEILAGKSDRDNDVLSIGTAHPSDWWFHIKGMSGSHVILSHPDHLEPSKELLECAAAVAAWHSKARNGGVTAVSCTQAKNVSKPRGAKPGTVHITKSRVLKVRPALPAAH
ncbi:MAG: NFACT RNA binding domain-containing protein [Kiritimatiellia bacterium]